jgi:uncharacterized membrane protein YkvA (DUF1232 family)
VTYALSPIDLIPDFIPLLGYLDDLLLVPLGVALALKLIPSQVMVEARAAAREVDVGDRPVSLVGAVAIVLIWLALAALGISLLVRALKQ